MKWELVAGSCLLFPSVPESGDRGNFAYTQLQMTCNLQTHQRAAGVEAKRYTLHSSGWGGGGEPPYGRDGHGCAHGVRGIDVLGRS